MSDDRDETRPFAPSGDATGPDAAKRADDATQPELPRVDDATQPELPRVGAGRGAVTDATQADLPPVDDATRVDSATPSTVAQPEQVPPVRRRRPDATSVMPAADDWAPGRGNPAWTGRAEVRAPRPGGSTYTEQDEWAAPVIREPRDRWWMPILVGIIALLLLTALGFGIYLIVQNSGGDGSPAPVASTAATPARTATATTAPTTAPTTEPTPEPSTTEPTATEVRIPALVGLSLPEAQAALARTGLRSYKLIYRDNDAPPGTVIGSDPAEGQEVPPDTTVTLVVARQSSATPTTAATTTGSTSEPGAGGD
jgi:hypothetical protein